MSSLKNKWIIITIAILLIGTITTVVLFLQQSSRLEDTRADIAFLGEQLSKASDRISFLESDILALTESSEAVSLLANDVSALRGNIENILVSQVELSIADIVAAVKPSVVSINTEVTVYSFGRAIIQKVAGSGWIFDEKGIIVTNYHVVEGASTITVTLDDGRNFTVNPNTVVADRINDLAILKIDAQNLPTVTVGDSSVLRLGDVVVAIGNALGMGTGAKEGIISRLDISLTVEGQKIKGLIETSAAINPGSSGGPLVNMSGEVIGITSAKVASIGVEGLGYAISMNVALPIIQGLIAGK